MWLFFVRAPGPRLPPLWAIARWIKPVLRGWNKYLHHCTKIWKPIAGWETPSQTGIDIIVGVYWSHKPIKIWWLRCGHVTETVWRKTLQLPADSPRIVTWFENQYHPDYKQENQENWIKQKRIKNIIMKTIDIELKENTCPGSPPKALMFSWTHLKAMFWVCEVISHYAFFGDIISH